MIFADVLYRSSGTAFADALYERNPLVFADALLKSWQTDTIIWHTNPQRDSDPNFPCDDCEELNGQEFDLTDLPDRPHFGCNCTLTDATTGEELSGLEMFMRVDTGEQRHHSAVTGAYTTRKRDEVHGYHGRFAPGDADAGPGDHGYVDTQAILNQHRDANAVYSAEGIIRGDIESLALLTDPVVRRGYITINKVFASQEEAQKLADNLWKKYGPKTDSHLPPVVSFVDTPHSYLGRTDADSPRTDVELQLVSAGHVTGVDYGGQTPEVLMHEMSHAISWANTGVMGHGADFRQTFINILTGQGYGRQAQWIVNQASPSEALTKGDTAIGAVLVNGQILIVCHAIPLLPLEDRQKFNSQHKPTGAAGGEFTTVGGPSTPGTGNDDGRNHNPATRQNWPTRTGSGAQDYTSPTHDLDTPPDTRVADPTAPAAPKNPHALDDDKDAPAGNTIRATHRRTDPNLTNDGNKKLNDLIDQGVKPTQAIAGYRGDGTVHYDNAVASIEASELKEQVTTALARRSGLSKERTNEFVATWAGSSSDTQPDSIALQMAAAAQFGVSPGDFMQAQADNQSAIDVRAQAFLDTHAHNVFGDMTSPPVMITTADGTHPAPVLAEITTFDSRMADASKFIAAMYAYTQKTLADLGIKSVTMYRGIGFDESDANSSPLTVGAASERFDQNATAQGQHEAAAASKRPATIDHNPITAWSTDAGQAVQFARSNDNGGGSFVLSADIPAARILSCAATGIGCQDENEATVIGGHGRKSDTVNVRQLQSVGSTQSEYAAAGGDAAAFGETKPGVDFSVNNIFGDAMAEADAIYAGHAEPTHDAAILTDEHVAAMTAQDPGGVIRNGVMHTHNPEAAYQAMSMGMPVQLEQPRELATLLGILHDKAQEAEAAGKDAEPIDLNLVTVKGTNLFTQESIGLHRIQMPQLSTKNPVPGSVADLTPRNDFGSVDLTDNYVQSLVDQGIRVTHETEQPAYLRATQDQLDGIKVGGMMRKIMAGKADELAARPIVISRDNYILDGHHTWAAMVGLDSEDGIMGNGTAMNVTRIDMSINDLLQSAQAYADTNGIPSVAVGKEKGPETPSEQSAPATPVPLGQSSRAPPRPITAEEMNDNPRSRAVSAEEYQVHALSGAALVADRQAHPSEPTATQSLPRLAMFSEVQKPWGGMSIDTHTGVIVPDKAPVFAVSVKEPHQASISIPEGSSFEQFSTALDTALTHFAPQLAMASAHLGVFHDTALHQIQIDPTIMVNSVQDAENVGAATHAIGGAYDFVTGDGVFPPHIGALGFGPSSLYPDGPPTTKAVENMTKNFASLGLMLNDKHVSSELVAQLMAAFRHATPAELTKVWYPHERAQIVAAIPKNADGTPMATEAQAVAIIAIMSNNMSWSTNKDGVMKYPNIMVAMALIKDANTNESHVFSQERLDKLRKEMTGTGKGLMFKWPDGGTSKTKGGKETVHTAQLPSKPGTYNYDDLNPMLQQYLTISPLGTGGMPEQAMGGLKIARARGDAIPRAINDNLGGNKVRSFASNIFDPNDRRYVTIDRHAARAMMHNFMSGKQVEQFIRNKDAGYFILSAHYFALTDILQKEFPGITPNQVQAIIWDQVRPMKHDDPAYATRYIMGGPQDDPRWGNKKNPEYTPMPSPFGPHSLASSSADQITAAQFSADVDARWAAEDRAVADERQRAITEEKDTQADYAAEDQARAQTWPEEGYLQVEAQNEVDRMWNLYGDGVFGHSPCVAYVTDTGGAKDALRRGTFAETDVIPGGGVYTGTPEARNRTAMITVFENVAPATNFVLIHELSHATTYYQDPTASPHGRLFRENFAIALKGEGLNDYAAAIVAAGGSPESALLKQAQEIAATFHNGEGTLVCSLPVRIKS